MAEVNVRAVEQILNKIDKAQDNGIQFARKMGLKPPRLYWFLSPFRTSGGPYPTKPVAAKALHWNNINGGYSQYDSACRVLERAGYLICDKYGQPITRSDLELVSEVKTSEAIREVIGRIGQDRFRARLMAKWKHCQVTGISDPELLRASHICPWSDNELIRGDLDNGLLLSALWDAAFDRGLLSFADDGRPLSAAGLSKEAKAILDFENSRADLSKGQRRYLQEHRKKHGFR